MALDNLLLVHARIGDARHLRGRGDDLGGRGIPATAGRGRRRTDRRRRVHEARGSVRAAGPRAASRRFSGCGSGAEARRRAARAGLCAGTAAVVFVGLLWVLDIVAPPYDAANGKPVSGGPFSHIAHMLSYASQQSSPSGPKGIASYPWQWLVDFKPITYLNINPAAPRPGSVQHPSCGPLPRVHQPGDHGAGAAGAGGRGRDRPFAANPADVRDAGAGVVPGDVRSVRAPQPVLEPHELSVLHGDRDAGHLHRDRVHGRSHRGAAESWSLHGCSGPWSCGGRDPVPVHCRSREPQREHFLGDRLRVAFTDIELVH